MQSARVLLKGTAFLGPGILVMLADTDAGSLVLSAQSGATWGYQLLLLQFFLIPILFIAQELTVRLGLVTGKGHGELIKEYYGQFWAWVSVVTLIICCIGALLTEFSGIAAVGEIFHIPVWETMSVVVFFLIAITWSGSYHSIERIAILVGVFEIVFVWIAWKANLSSHQPISFTPIPWHNKSYLYLVAGNIGAVIMPWMIFFQQSAVIDKKLSLSELKSARFDTAIGAILTQIIMASVLIICASTIGKVNPNVSLTNITQISDAIVPVLGPYYGRILFTLGMAGAAIVATIVVSLTIGWCVGEVLGVKHSLEDNPKSAPWFYGSYTLVILLCAFLVISNAKNLVKLSVSIEVMNALFLPLVLVFLFLLACKALPVKYALKGWYKIIVGILFIITSGFGLFAGVSGMLLGW